MQEWRAYLAEAVANHKQQSVPTPAAAPETDVRTGFRCEVKDSASRRAGVHGASLKRRGPIGLNTARQAIREAETEWVDAAFPTGHRRRFRRRRVTIEMPAWGMIAASTSRLLIRSRCTHHQPVVGRRRVVAAHEDGARRPTARSWL